MPGAEVPVVLAAAAAGLVDFIAAQGGDIDTIFGRCGIAPEMTDAPTLQLPLDTFCALFEEGARQTRNDNFGLWFGQQFAPRDLGMWGYAALSSPNLGAALGNFVDLFRYQQGSSVMRLAPAGANHMRLEYRIEAPAILARRQDAELSLGQFTNVIRECCGRHWSPLEVHFEHPRPENWRQHEMAFGAPVFFGAASNAILFERALLARPMPGSDPKLLAMMRSCLESMGSHPQAERLADRILSAIRQRLAEGAPNLEEIAATLRLSPGAIQKALSAEGLGFREAVEHVRFELARHYLAQLHLPLSEIALLLGYSELSAFTRAFTRWSGVSPRRWRAGLARH
ncbi:AraC-like DNA-binding protein [Dongia mobilis]|uniref:AraC-like DNA-binding protein n=1 Tax=Dongia mobilis TaxID=578943 RepID=A0A4R6WSL2_9PROT|nr:AraC family transcriptional regulator [Dongia mobilis]TDQ82044.1 AraC-like DNA-binding protein [Dongia mobilis]